MEKNATTAREKLHHFIDEIEDTRAINLYEVFKLEMKEDNCTYTDEFVAELEQIEKDIESGKMEVYDWKDVKKEMEEYIKSKR